MSLLDQHVTRAREQRQAELEAVLGDKGAGAARQTAIAHALEDHSEWSQYGEDYWDDYFLARASSDMDTKGGRKFNDGDLLLAHCEPGLNTFSDRYLVLASRGFVSVVELDRSSRIRRVPNPDECAGHESTSGPAGVSYFCDGSCVPLRG
jgi:hypothetical protein